jgi:hypothetical protein
MLIDTIVTLRPILFTLSDPSASPFSKMPVAAFPTTVLIIVSKYLRSWIDLVVPWNSLDFLYAVLVTFGLLDFTYVLDP